MLCDWASTGEAAGGDNVDEKVDELFSNAAEAIISLVQNHSHSIEDGEKEELLKGIRGLSLPPNPLDDLIDQLGGPARVAEMTGRSVRWVKGRAGAKDSWKLTRRVKDDRGKLTINIEERKMFQTGRKLVAIISAAASSGISLQVWRQNYCQRDYSNVCEQQNRLQISLKREENDSDNNVDITD